MSLRVNFFRFQQHCLILKTKKFFQLRQRFGYPTPLTIFENRHKCANQSDCLLWNLFLECYCSETMRARRMVVKSFFRALFCPITFAVLVRWHLSFFQCNPWPYTATLCEVAHICTYICDPLSILGHIIADIRDSMCISALHNRTKPMCIHKNCCCKKWAKNSGGDISTVASTKCQPSSCAVPGGKYLLQGLFSGSSPFQIKKCFLMT